MIFDPFNQKKEDVSSIDFFSSLFPDSFPAHFLIQLFSLLERSSDHDSVSSGIGFLQYRAPICGPSAPHHFLLFRFLLLAHSLLGLPPAQGHLDAAHLRLLEHVDGLRVGQSRHRLSVHCEDFVS